MKQSEKANTIVIRTETIHENGFTYRYILYQKQNLHASYRPPLYSIRAELTEDDGEVYAAEVTDAFADPGHALIFFSLCHEHLVMPIHLSDVLMDFEH